MHKIINNILIIFGENKSKSRVAIARSGQGENVWVKKMAVRGGWKLLSTCTISGILYIFCQGSFFKIILSGKVMSVATMKRL